MQLSEQKRKKRVLGFFVLTCVLFTALITRTFFLQIVQSAWLVEKASGQWTRETSVDASRGAIYDRTGEVLAQSGSADSVILHPKAINASKDAAQNAASSQNIASKLAPVLGMDEAAILAKATDTSKYDVWLKRQINADQSSKIKAMALKGVGLTSDTKRYYPKGDFLTQVLGFTSVDGAGIEGLEKFYEQYLSGKSGSLTAKTDERGNVIAFADASYVPATNGNSVYLTVDYMIQSYVEKAAQQAYDQFHPKSVMCIVMDPKTGAILAMANKPGYDLNNPPKDNASLFTALSRNLVVSNANDPGSVFKVFTMAAALDAGVASESNTFNCDGGREYGGSFIHCDNDHGDNISLATALAKSCNSVFMDLAVRLGTQKLYSYIKNFGFGSKTGVDLSGESSGIMIPEKDVKQGDLARIGFGQSITVTPLQTLTAFCAMINGGNLMTPHLLDKIVSADGQVVKTGNTTPQRQVISAQTSQRVKNLLRYVVTNGSGAKSAVPGYTVGGKTGTAQKYDENGHVKSTHLSSFIGFAPVEDPQIAVLFLVDEAQVDDDYGSTVAAPAVKQILEQSLQYMGVQPHYTASELATMGSVQVPYLIGKTKEEAKNALEALGLKVFVSGTSGKVIEQMPAANEVVKKNETVAITIKTDEQMGPAEMVDVPDLSGKTVAQCQEILNGLGLNLYSHGKGKAIWQNIKSGNKVAKRTEIRVEFAE